MRPIFFYVSVELDSRAVGESEILRLALQDAGFFGYGAGEPDVAADDRVLADGDAKSVLPDISSRKTDQIAAPIPFSKAIGMKSINIFYSTVVF